MHDNSVRMKRYFLIVALLGALVPAQAQKNAPIVSIGGSGARTRKAAPADNSLLPKIFAGWQLSGNPEISTDPAVADPTNAGILKEYGFHDFESATYTRLPGRKLAVKAARFKDATGAYGAFTFYKVPEMLNVDIGDQGSSANERVLFYKGNVLVQAVLDQVTGMSAAELRELADDLPKPQGPAASLPTLPTYLPKQSYVKNSAKYVLGPVGLASAHSPLSPDVVDFGREPEIVLGDYNSSTGTARLMLILYPTPQIAGERLRALESSQPAGDANEFLAKRTGPILAVVSGKISAGEAKSLLASVNYDAQVTWNQPTSLNKKDNIGNLIINNFLLIAIIFGFAIVLGIAFGGIRILVKRFFPDRVFDRDIEIIQLNLR